MAPHRRALKEYVLGPSMERFNAAVDALADKAALERDDPGHAPRRVPVVPPPRTEPTGLLTGPAGAGPALPGAPAG